MKRAALITIAAFAASVGCQRAQNTEAPTAEASAEQGDRTDSEQAGASGPSAERPTLNAERDDTEDDKPSSEVEQPTARLFGTVWRLKSLHGRPAGKGAGGQAPFIEFNENAGRIAGFGGCNQMSGSYEREGETLKVGNVAMTAMACPEGMKVEKELAAALEETTRYRVSGDKLSLLSSEDEVVAVFEARKP